MSPTLTQNLTADQRDLLNTVKDLAKGERTKDSQRAFIEKLTEKFYDGKISSRDIQAVGAALGERNLRTDGSSLPDSLKELYLAARRDNSRDAEVKPVAAAVVMHEAKMPSGFRPDPQQERIDSIVSDIRSRSQGPRTWDQQKAVIDHIVDMYYDHKLSRDDINRIGKALGITNLNPDARDIRAAAQEIYFGARRENERQSPRVEPIVVRSEPTPIPERIVNVKPEPEKIDIDQAKAKLRDIIDDSRRDRHGDLKKDMDDRQEAAERYIKNLASKISDPEQQKAFILELGKYAVKELISFDQGKGSKFSLRERVDQAEDLADHLGIRKEAASEVVLKYAEARLAYVGGKSAEELRQQADDLRYIRREFVLSSELDKGELSRFDSLIKRTEAAQQPYKFNSQHAGISAGPADQPVDRGTAISQLSQAMNDMSRAELRAFANSVGLDHFRGSKTQLAEAIFEKLSERYGGNRFALNISGRHVHAEDPVSF